MDLKDEIAGELKKGLEETVALFRSLSPAELGTRLYADGAQWTVQQVLAHFAAIERSMHWLFRNILAGGPGAPPDFDFERYNRSQTPKYESLTLDELIALDDFVKTPISVPPWRDTPRDTEFARRACPAVAGILGFLQSRLCQGLFTSSRPHPGEAPAGCAGRRAAS
jgi:hypothetical protein